MQRRLSLASQDSIDAEHDLDVQAELVDAVVTDADTARVRVTTTNVGPRRALSVGTDGCDAFDRGLGASRPEGLWLYRADATDSIDRQGDRWEPDVPAGRPRGFGGYACPARVYATDESVTTEYEVWDDYRVRGYLDPGVYRWATDVRVWADPAAEASDPPSETVRWGFAVQVSE